MGIKNVIKKVASKGADRISKLSALSPEQVEQVQAKREEYLQVMPNLAGPEAEEVTGRMLAANAVEIYHAYLAQIKELYTPVVKTAEYENEEFHSGYNIRYINITKWVTDKRENSLEKLVNVYEVLSNDECNISLVFHRKISKTNVYLAITNTDNDNDNVDVESYRRRLESAIRGNFPGSAWDEKVGRGQLPCFDKQSNYSVATVSNVPTEKSEKFISQTVEKLLDGIVPETVEQEYILVLLATPIQNIADRKLVLSQIYSDLAPYASWQTNYTYTESDARGSSATVGINVGASAGSQTGTNSSMTDTSGRTDTEGISETKTTSKTKGENHSVSGTIGASDTTSVGINAGPVNLGVSTTISASVSAAKGWMTSKTKSFAKGVTKSVAKSTSQAVTSGASKALNMGVNFGANFARTSNVTATIGKNEGITQSFTNYNVKHALELLEEQMKRFEKSTALGMWDFAAYVLSEDQTVANNVAHSYLALTQGEESHMSQTVVNLWRGDIPDEKGRADEITGYLRDLRHPIFALNPDILEVDETFSVYPPLVTATTALSGKELAYSLNFPQKSIAGLPVLECAEFGRNISSYTSEENEKAITLGKIFHMNHSEKLDAKISLNSLASHTFITGSTGTGKSNTVYKLLNEVRNKGVKFLVIEPAKGEYKHVFGNDEDVSVYGTNPDLTKLLQINPFEFPKGIHVLEHIDRLIEIFNVCWPMYAAMPAVLKSAVEKSYEDSGWDLLTSKNAYVNLYPTFKDVARNIKMIIDSSEYDSENKGAYKGSLLTRLESLTNGINGLIFSSQSISDEKLFDENIIIDLSRVGSTETKSLIMGMLVLKLQEYRMTHTESLNNPLKHVTVLEEAHNILKRTSSEQSMEGGNLVGKSVEMIANSIAEMRTYGEGFIIADQAPGLMDMSVIRNTNTKMILRLPDFSDRELVGKSANLNDDQIVELAKLPRGVAALYQNEWTEPVLCQVDRFEDRELAYTYTNKKNRVKFEPIIKVELLRILLNDVENVDILNIQNKLELLKVSGFVKATILEFISMNDRELKPTDVAPIVGEFFPDAINVLKKSYEKGQTPDMWTNSIQNSLSEQLEFGLPQPMMDVIVQGIITQYFLNEINNHLALKEWQERGYLI